MAVRFIKQDLVKETNCSDGVLVIDTSLQGIWEFNELADMKWAFPRAYDIYRMTCLMDYKKRLGTAMLIEDSGYKIIFLFTKRRFFDSKEEILTNFKFAITDMFRLIPKDIKVYSPIMGRMDGVFKEMWGMISYEARKREIEWNICRKESSRVGSV